MIKKIPSQLGRKNMKNYNKKNKRSHSNTTVILKRIIIVLLFFSLISISMLGVCSATTYTVSGSDFQSIQNTIDSASSGSVILLGSKTYTASSSSSCISTTSKKNITIQGESNNNRGTIDAKNLQSILYIPEGSSATIRYVNFVNGGLNTPSLRAYGTILIENCSFINSRGNDCSAIYVGATAPNTIIKNCNFINNITDNSLQNYYTKGSAVCVNAPNVEILNCYFSGNKALNDSGALTIRNNANNVKITGCTFTNNQGPLGGAVVINHSDGVTISNCNFNNNKASIKGGAIYYTQSSNGQILNCNFYGNSVNNGGGGAIYFIYGNNNLISGCTFNNSNALWGGAILSDSYSTGLKITTSKFNNNNADLGGAICIFEPLTVNYSDFNSNKASYGGAIFSYSMLNIAGSNFNYNQAKETGGALSSTSTVNINNSYFTGNTGKNGGAIYSSTLTGYKNTFLSNRATQNGGAIYSNTINSISGSSFSSNQATQDGGAIYSNTIYSISKSSFLYNSANRGGAISVFNSFKLYSTTFINNKCGLDFKIELLPKWIQFTSKVKVTITRKDNVKVGNTKYSIYYGGKGPSYIDNMMVFIDTSTNDLPINVNGISTITKNSVTTVTVKTHPSYTWGGIVFTGSFGGNSEFIPCSGSLTIQARILKTDVYNLEKNSKGKVSKLYYFPYRKDTFQTIYNGKTYTTTRGKYASYDVYFLGGEKIFNSNNAFIRSTSNIYLLGEKKVPSNFQAYLVNHKFVADVNHTLIKKQIINILKSKKYKVEGLITQEKKGRVLYYWVKQNTKYQKYGNTKYGGVGTLKRVLNKKIKYDANCADQVNLLVTMFRTVGIPIYYESWRIYKNVPDSGHLISRAYVNGKWVQLDPTRLKSKWGVPEWKQSDGKYIYSQILYTNTYVSL